MRSLINGQKYTACLPLIYVLSIQYITSSCIFKWQESGMGKNDRFYSCMPGAHFTKYITIYSKIILSFFAQEQLMIVTYLVVRLVLAIS